MNRLGCLGSGGRMALGAWVAVLALIPLIAMVAALPVRAAPSHTEGASTAKESTSPAAASGHSAAQRPARQRPPPLAIGAAFAPDGALWTVGLDAQRRLVLQRSRDQGRSWQEPQMLDVAGDTVVADGENRPKLAFGPDGLVVVSYTKPLPKPFTGEVRLLRSADGGKTFAPPVTVHADRSIITHRFESILFDRNGTLHTVWIDKRDGEAVRAAGRPYRGAGIYRNESRDGGLTFGPDIKVADHSCECCRIALAPTSNGGVAAMWRHVFEPNERDHAFSTWTGADKQTVDAPVRATFDRWALDACPHHGPGLSAAADGGWHAVWFGIRAGQAGVRYGRLDVMGRPLSSVPVRTVPDPGAEHADVAAIGSQVVVVWRSFDGQRFTIRAWVSRDGGQRFELRELAHTVHANDQPRLVSDGTRLWLLWRDVHRTQVEVIDVH